MEVTVSPEDLPGVFFDGSVYVVTGTAGDKRVTFVGDHGPTSILLRAVAESGEEQTAFVEDFAITRTVTIRRCATVGCKADATEVIKYRLRGERATDSVCTPCADSYSRRPAITIIARHPIFQRSA